MRFQHLQQSYSSRHKLAALLTLLAPVLASADEAGNVLRQGAIEIAPTLNAATGDTDNDVRGVDHTVLVPLPEKLLNPSKPQALLIATEGDGWVPRAGRSPRVSPLVVDPLARSAESLVPVPRLRIGDGPLLGQTALLGQTTLGGPPLLSDPATVGPPGQPSSGRVGDDLIGLSPAANDFDSPIKIGESASSTLKMIPNVLEPKARSLELQPEATEQPIADSDSVHVDDPEQNEPQGELTSEAIDAGDANVDVPSDASDFEASDVDMLPDADDTPLEPLSTDEWETDAKSVEDSGEVAEPAPLEIRKLRLSDDFPGGSSLGDATVAELGMKSQSAIGSGDPVSLKPLDPSIAKMRVGDVEPRPLSEYEAPKSEGLVQPPSRSVRSGATNPIQGDAITAEGELILASGQQAAKIALKRQTAVLKSMIERTLNYYWDRPEDAAVRTHWGMLHSIMVFDRDTQIISRRQRFNAVAWMAGNNPCRNQTLFTQDQYGILPKTGVGLQGHQGQLLAIFGLINVPLNYPVYASNQKFAVADILQREMRDCKVNTELTFTLIALAHYADSDATWVSGDGEDWSVPRVIQEELGQPIVGAACGGTHRLMGFGHALRRRQAEGKAIDGQWERADRYVKDFVNYTWSLQNRDGSMSTAWYEKQDDNGDIDRKIQTTGHMLEMLLTVTPDADLQSPEMLRTVNFMANTLYTERGHQWQIGPKGHALRSLAMYYQRVFGSATPWRPSRGSRSAGAPAVRSVR